MFFGSDVERLVYCHTGFPSTDASLSHSLFYKYNGSDNDKGDFSFILASNRDEYYERPTLSLLPWQEDSDVYGGRDQQPGAGEGTWLALSPKRKKIGVLLNMPGNKIENAKSRGKLVADYVKCEMPTEEYISHIKSYVENCNEFVLVTGEFRSESNFYPSITTYNNVLDEIEIHLDKWLGFGNCLPSKPLKKVEAGKKKLADVCNKFNSVEKKEQLIEELLLLLKSNERYLPDHQLENRVNLGYENLSSIFVSIPNKSYGTRSHTIVLVTKTGHGDIIEVTSENLNNTPKWKRTEYQFQL